MFVRVLRGSLLALSLAGLLVWLYVIARILSTVVIPDGVTFFHHYVSFWGLGIIAFLVSFACMMLYMASRGLPRKERSSKEA